MWAITTRGFFSAVQHATDPTLLVVRTRDHGDATNLAAWYAGWLTELADLAAEAGILRAAPPEAEVTSYAVSDYPWRVIMPRTAWVAFIAETASDVDYGNFKDAVKDRQGPERAGVYSRVWGALLEVEHLDPERRAYTMYGPDADDQDWEDPFDWDTYLDDEQGPTEQRKATR